MKTNRLHRVSARALCFALSLFLWSAAQGQPKPADAPAAATTATTASQETPAPVKTAPADKSATNPADKSATTPAEKPPSAPEAAAPNPADADKVALNLRGANIDQVLSFLSELTGMPVMKQKDAKAQITIVNKDKVAKQDAIRMICEALRLDGTAVVMRDHIIWLVPDSQVSSLDIGLTLEPGKLPQAGIITRALQVKFADVTELEKIIRPLLGKNATLIAAPATRQLIITDAADRILNVERVLAQLDALDVDNRQLQIFQLKYAEADELAVILRAIMTPPPRANSGSSPGQPNPGQPVPGQPGAASANKPVNDVDIEAYKAANWLVAVAPKEKLVKIAQLVAEMDQQLTQEVKLRTIAVKYASAQDLARQLSTLIQNRYDNKKVREVIQVAADQRSNTIVVLSSEQNYKAIQSIVAQLDTEESLETKTEWFELKHADAEDLAQQMNDLYQGMQQNQYPFFFFFGGNRQPATRFVCEKRSNSLIAIAPPAEMDRIRKLVERLDQVVDAEQGAPRLYPIKHTDAKELADVLNKVFGVEDATTITHGYWENVQQVGGNKVGRLNGKVRFDPLITGNAIIVTTSNKENFPIIEGFLHQMDEALPESSNLLVIVLKNAQASDVADQLNVLFGREGTKVPTRTPQNTTTPQQGQQGQPGQPGQPGQLQQQAQPQTDELAEGWTLSAPPPLKDARPLSDLIGRVRVVADLRTNALLVTTQPENRDAVRKLVEQLDAPSPKVYVSVRLIEVSRTNASYVGVRYSSTPSLFSSTDFDNGLQANLGVTWQTVFHNGVLSASGVNTNEPSITPAVLAQYIMEHFDSRILSDTSLTMENNRQGQVFVGSQIPILNNSAISNGFQSQGYNYQNVGTNLTMTPIINSENRVVMNINMQASQLEPGVQILGGVVIDSRTFTTILAVENSQTIVMGGIMSEQYVENVRRFPILGYIPVLDWIFAKKDKQRVVTEIIAFITPVVLRGPADAADITHKTEEDLKRRQEWPVLPPEKGESPDDKGVGGEMK